MIIELYDLKKETETKCFARLFKIIPEIVCRSQPHPRHFHRRIDKED